MKYWFCILFCVVSACAKQNYHSSKQAHFVDVGQTSFAIFADEDSVTAVKVGEKTVGSITTLARKAVKAITYATKCDIADGSINTDGKSVHAALNCSDQASVYQYIVYNSKVLSERVLPDLSDLDLNVLRKIKGKF